MNGEGRNYWSSERGLQLRLDNFVEISNYLRKCAIDTARAFVITTLNMQRLTDWRTVSYDDSTDI